jgi:hypothetical protein
MVNMLKVKVRWQGFTGSPGWSNFYFGTESEGFHTDEQADAVADKVEAFFVAIKAHFPNQVTWAPQSDVEEIDPANGNLMFVRGTGARQTVSGTAASAAYSAASGAVVTWRTGGVRNGRRVRGRTFLVPTAMNAYEFDGSLQAPVITTLTTAAAALLTPVSGLQLGIWARPTAPGATDGEWFPVQGATVPDMAAVLRSRRD